MPSPLTPAKLEKIWDKFEGIFPSTVTIQRQATTNGVSSGSQIDITENVPCWFIDAGGNLPTLLASMLTTGTLKQNDSQRAVFAGRREVKNGDNLIKNGTRYAVGQVKRDDLGIAAIADVSAVLVART